MSRILMYGALTVLAAVSFSPNLFAKAPKKTRSKDSPLQTEQKVAAAPTDDGSSAFARCGKSGAVGLRYGNIIGGLSGGGIDGYMFHGSGFHLGGAFYSVSEDFADSIKEDETSVRLTKATAEGKLILLQARYFFGNSFHVTGGVGQRQIKASFAAESTITTDKVAIDVDVSSWVAQLAIGNTWYWTSGVFVGADWIGYVVPLSSSRKVASSATGGVSSSLQEIQDMGEDLGDKLGKTNSAMALVLNFGFAF